MLTARCGVCHGENGQMGLNVTSYASLMEGSQNGPVIAVQDPQNSLLVQKQSGDTPHFAQLTAEELDLMIQWIQAGAPE